MVFPSPTKKTPLLSPTPARGSHCHYRRPARASLLCFHTLYNLPPTLLLLPVLFLLSIGMSLCCHRFMMWLPLHQPPREREIYTSFLHANTIISHRFDLRPVMIADATTLNLILTIYVVSHYLSPPSPYTPLPSTSYYDRSKLPYPY